MPLFQHSNKTNHPTKTAISIVNSITDFIKDHFFFNELFIILKSKIVCILTLKKLSFTDHSKLCVVNNHFLVVIVNDEQLIIINDNYLNQSKALFLSKQIFMESIKSIFGYENLSIRQIERIQYFKKIQIIINNSNN